VCKVSLRCAAYIKKALGIFRELIATTTTTTTSVWGPPSGSKNHSDKLCIFELDDCNRMYTVVAVGCADLPAISDAWTVRDGDLAIVRCNHSRQVFHLKCNGNVWFGDLTNCTSGASLYRVVQKSRPRGFRHICSCTY